MTFEVGNVYHPRFEPRPSTPSSPTRCCSICAVRSTRCADAALLTPGGVIGVREVDWGSMTFYPENEGMRRFLRLYHALAHRNGGEPERRPPHAPLVPGGGLRRYARDDVDDLLRGADETRDWADTYADRTLQSNLADKAVEYGLASGSDLEAMAAAWRAWGRDRDAFFCFS